MFSNGKIHFIVLTDSLGQEFKNGAPGMDPFCFLLSGASAGKSLMLGFLKCLGLESSGARGGEACSPSCLFTPMSVHLKSG